MDSSMCGEVALMTESLLTFPIVQSERSLSRVASLMLKKITPHIESHSTSHMIASERFFSRVHSKIYIANGRSKELFSSKSTIELSETFSSHVINQFGLTYHFCCFISRLLNLIVVAYIHQFDQ